MKNLLLILLSTVILLQAQVLYTKRASNHLREGAGSFFPLIDVIGQSVQLKKLEQDGKWIKVKLPDGREGWMGDQSVTDKLDAKAAATTKTPQGDVQVKVSKAKVAAAIKGFAKKVNPKLNEGQNEEVFKMTSNKFSASEFRAFYNALLQTNSSNKDKLQISDLRLPIPEYDPSFQEQQIGYSIATRLAARGIVNNPAVTKYVNMIAAAIAFNSNCYETDFTVLILDDPTLNGFAIPGGYIFITKGALQKCNDESEIAGLIAHEMVHIFRRHGLQELSKQKGRIKQQDAMDEMEKEIEESGMKEENDDFYSEVTEELNDMVDDMYEKIIHKRLLAYELEADKVGTVLIANTGYDPAGLSRACQQVASVQKEKPDVFDSKYLSLDATEERAKKIVSFVSSKYSKSSPGATLQERFRSTTSSVR